MKINYNKDYKENAKKFAEKELKEWQEVKKKAEKEIRSWLEFLKLTK